MGSVKISRWRLLVNVAFLITITRTVISVEVEYESRRFVGEGQPLTITCRRSAFGGPKWTKNGASFIPDESNNHSYIEEKTEGSITTMKLHIFSVRMEDRAEYKCDAHSANSHKVEVVPQKETDRERTFPSVLLKTSETLELYCSSGVENSAFSFNWYKDGHRILEKDDPRFKLIGKRLILSDSTEEDAGDYLCSVEGHDGLSYPVAPDLDRLIQVTYAARVEKFPPQIRPILGRNLTLECRVQGYPIPRIAWFVDGIPAEMIVFNTSGRVSILDNAEGLPNALFFIQDVTYEDDYNVTCLAENFQGSMNTSVKLAIRENVINTNEEYPGRGIVLTPGSKLVLECNVTDNPTHSVNWYKNGHPINESDDRLSLETHNVLNISKTTEDDSGNYMCVTASGNFNATITVRTKVKLWTFEHSKNVVQGQNVLIYCNVTQGKPTPTLQWFKDGEPLILSDNDTRISLSVDKKGIADSQLTIKDTDFNDRAEYMCTATNDLGSVNGTILVRIKDKYAALWPFLGICAEVAILCTIIFIYEKKRQKPDFDESDADHNTENKNVPDQEEKSQDVRQRK